MRSEGQGSGAVTRVGARKAGRCAWKRAGLAGRAGVLAGLGGRFGVIGLVCLVGSVSLVGSLVGCSSFGSTDEDATAGADAASFDGASTDASVDDAQVADASDADVGDAPSALCTASFCDDFERVGLVGNWKLQGDKAILNTSPLASRSPTRSLRASFTNGASSAALIKDFPGVKRVVARAWLKMPEVGTGEIDLFGIITQNTDVKPIALVHSGEGFILEGPSLNDPKAQVTSPLTPWKYDEWTLVTIEVDLTARTFGLTVGAASAGPFTLPDAWEKNALPLSVEIGVPFAGWTSTGVTAWNIFYDDVEVLATP